VVDDSTRPRWFRPGFAALLLGSPTLYLWKLGSFGYTNPFYAAAVQSSTRSAVAWLFAAVDAPGFITVDKPPADNWLMGLSANLFGFSTWSMLVPQALLGVASVAVLTCTVRRWASPGTALAAGALFALTPVAVIMFRFDDPDPMLAFLLLAAGYALVRGIDQAPRRSGTWWIIAAGALIGLGFLAKMGAALLVVPAFVAVHLLVADVPPRRRIGQLTAAASALLVSAGWFALVALWPAASRPWIGGSTDNSLLQLALGYNGLSRILGRGPGGGGGHGAAAHTGAVSGADGFAGGQHIGGGHGAASAGLGRMFSAQFAGQIAWLLPAALIALTVLLWATRTRPRQDRLRASALLWGAWLLISGAVFSFMAGTIHPYYTIVMAPPIAALVAIGALEAWRHRGRAEIRSVLAVTLLVTGAWNAVLLRRSPTFVPWLTWVVLAASLLVALVVITSRVPMSLTGTGPRRVATAVTMTCALLAVTGGPAAYAVDTVAVAHSNSQASAGPQTGPRLGGRAPAGSGPQNAGVHTTSTPTGVPATPATPAGDPATDAPGAGAPAWDRRNAPPPRWRAPAPHDEAQVRPKSGPSPARKR